MDNIKKSVNLGIIWTAIEKLSQSGVQFLINIIIARALSPDDFGMISMIMVFITLSRVFIDSGLSYSLIQKKNVSDSDYSTAFIVNIVISVILYILIYISAEPIAIFYNISKLEQLTKVIALILPISTFSIINKTILTIRLDFKTQAKITVFASSISGLFGIIFAYSGYGVWSLVIQSLSNSLINTLLLKIYCRWNPSMIFSINSLKSLYNFGSKLLVAQLISVVYNNLYTLIIGKKFNSKDLGFYSRSEQFAYFAQNQISNIIFKVSFSALSKIQDNDDLLKNIYLKYLKYISFFVFPFMIIISSLSESIIIVLLTEKWNNSIILLQILAIAAMWDPISVINLNLLYVKGRSDLVLKLEVIKKSIGVIILILTIPYGLVVLSIGQIIYNLIALLINMHYTPKVINIKISTQIKILLPILLVSLLTGVLIYTAINITDNHLIKLCIGLFFSPILYIFAAVKFKIVSTKELKNILSSFKS